MDQSTSLRYYSLTWVVRQRLFLRINKKEDSLESSFYNVSGDDIREMVIPIFSRPRRFRKSLFVSTLNLTLKERIIQRALY